MTLGIFLKRFSPVLLAWVLLFFFGVFPCPASADHAPPVHRGVLKKVLDAHTLRVGVSLFTPWVIQDAQGNLSGFEVDVAEQLGRDLGVKIQFRVYDWEDILPALLKDEIDIIVAGMTITPQRALQVSFSQPYEDSGVGLATNITLTKDFQSLNDLDRGKIHIAAISETVAEDFVRRVFPKATLVSFLTSKGASKALLAGKVHAYVEHNPIPTFLALDHPKDIDQPLSKALITTRAGFAIMKGNPDFINFLNAWITAHKADEWLASIHQFWFESVTWRIKVNDTP
jgi:polar amino acid transport system substrate-binding protein